MSGDGDARGLEAVAAAAALVATRAAEEDALRRNAVALDADVYRLQGSLHLEPSTLDKENQMPMKLEQQESAVEQQQGGEEKPPKDILLHFEQILHDDPLIDEVGFLHPTQFCSLDCAQDGDSASQSTEFHRARYFWCRDHKLAISAEILPELYHAARDAYHNARDAPLSPTNLMRHTKALLILCPDLLTAWNSRKMVLSALYDFTKLKDELQLCALILSYSPKNESTWSHRRWVIKQVAEQHQDMLELIGNESILVKEIAEKSKMNYRAWRHRCWLIPYMTRKQVLDELNESTRWSELHVADNCCFHYRRSLLLALLDNFLGNEEDSLSWESDICLLWKEELRWDEMLIRRYQGREDSDAVRPLHCNIIDWFDVPNQSAGRKAVVMLRM